MRLDNIGNIREHIENIEERTLSPLAYLSSRTKGRAYSEKECSIRPAFQHDRDRIVHSKAFRRLEDKTQVFLSPQGSHYRNRLTHTLEVSQIARTVAKALFLNESLTEAVAMGHDLGHTPFGHAGERALNRLYKKGFRHEKQSLRIVESIAKSGRGLNLTLEVRDGILNHSKGMGKIKTRKSIPFTLEGQVVRLSDIVAYINHDIDDACRSGILKSKDIPHVEIIGESSSRRINAFVRNMIKTSHEHIMSEDAFITFDDFFHKIIEDIRQFMFENVYNSREIRKEFRKAETVVEFLFEYFMENYNELQNYYSPFISEEQDTNVVDFIASLTDNYAITLYNSLFIPKRMKYPGYFDEN